MTLDSILKNTNIDSFKDLFENAIIPILITDVNWKGGLKIIYVNRAFCNATGYQKDELIGRNPKIFQGEKSNCKILKELKTELIKGNNFTGQSINYKKDRTTYHVRWSISPLRDDNQNIIAYISYQKIISNNTQIENEKLLSSIVNISNNLILATDLDGYVIYTNEAFEKKLGYKKEELIGKHTRVLKSGLQGSDFYKKMWHQLFTKGEFSDIFISSKKNGTLFYDKKEIKTIYDKQGNPLYYVSISQDISSEVEKQKNLELQVYKDSLTGLFNRKKYDISIEKKIKNYENTQPFCLVEIDIDHFKSINDNYGHDIGDYILQEFSKILVNNTRGEDEIFRWGGEEFVVLINKNKNDTFVFCEKLRNKIANKNLQSIKITASFGITQYEKNLDQNTIFKQADKALYKAKQSGRNKTIIYYDLENE